jgi:hypothetical protein
VIGKGDIMDYKDELRKGICEITFQKKNGDIREMVCTLSMNHIPEDKQPKGTGTEKPSKDAIAVWDVRKEDWRSFRIDSVITFERLTGHGVKGEKDKVNGDAIPF